MRCRSDSVKRTVVDLSISFFMSLNSCKRTIDLSLPKRNKEAHRQLGDIFKVSPSENFSEHRIAIGNVMYKVRDYPKERPSPSGAVASRLDEAGQPNLDSGTSLPLLQIRN
jgi:hypothetical protein